LVPIHNIIQKNTCFLQDHSYLFDFQTRHIIKHFKSLYKFKTIPYFGEKPKKVDIEQYNIYISIVILYLLKNSITLSQWYSGTNTI